MIDRTSGLDNLVRSLKKRWQLAATIACAILVLFLLGTLLATPIYEGVAQVIIERVETDNLTGGTRVYPRDPEFDTTQYQLIRSHAVARRVVALLSEPAVKAELDSRRRLPAPIAFFGEVLDLFSAARGDDNLFIAAGGDPVAWTESDRLAAELAENVRVQPIQRSQITAISYFSPDPLFAARAAEAYVKGYLEETLNMKLEATRRNLDWMTSKAETERIKLQASEKKLQEFMVANKLVTLEDRLTILPEQFAQLGRDLVQAEMRAKEQKLLYDRVSRAGGNPDAADSVLSTSESATLDVLRAQILQAEQAVSEMSGKYGARHPLMLKAQADLNILKEKRREEIARITEKVRNQYELARSSEVSLRGQISMTRAEALGMNEKYAQYSALKREMETNRQVFTTLLGKIKDQSITGESRPVNVWVVAEAKIPADPARPILWLNALLGLMVGGFSAVGGVFCAERLDNRIKSPDGLDEILGVPTLGSVSAKRQTENMSEIVKKSPRSEYAESYNALRTTLILSTANTPPKRMLVTSAIAGEGKSTTAVNLALAMAKSGSRVLLIDADLRRGTLHSIFGVGNKVGLSSFLAGAAEDEEVINYGGHDNLALIPSGPIPPNPYELLNSGRMAVLLESVGEKGYDMVICDSSPVFSVADPRVLSKYFDGVLVVTRAELTTYQMAQRCVRMLSHVNARILGTFVNSVKTSQQPYYRYYSSYLDESHKPEAGTGKA